ncbi:MULTISPECIES: hypothetical protein [Bacillus amyloliquefaciens group]|uniref:hypothetical protein n=1 Tax=Bacillus amyloliquefaciens group TaxID=1938374 RepID=UPI00073CF35F|nr:MULTISPECIES: hypothetical protein [Bacillus amyloliquefaciens group]KTF59125.1 hypothetical protein AR691_17735 [Bacillus amyloliquefaciens]
MTVKTWESYVLSEENIEEINVKINEFCKNGFSHTHDWMEYRGMPSKRFDQLTFEKDFPSYRYNSDAKWVKGKFKDESGIWLKSSQNKWLFPAIDIGNEIMFADTAIYHIEQSMDCKYVGKIY